MNLDGMKWFQVNRYGKVHPSLIFAIVQADPSMDLERMSDKLDAIYLLGLNPWQLRVEGVALTAEEMKRVEAWADHVVVLNESGEQMFSIA